jgi:hypothetical protein
MGAIVIRTRYDEGTESAEVATSVSIASFAERIGDGKGLNYSSYKHCNKM